MASSDSPKPEEKNGTPSGDKEVVFLAPECPVVKVTVYPDRAEVCRIVETSLSTGLNQVVIKKLPDKVDSDSIRVEGKGEATITEVVFHTESVPKGGGNTSEQEKHLQEEYDELNEQKKILESEMSVLRKRWGLLDSFATTASKGGGATKDGDSKTGGRLELTESFFKGLTDFLQLYSKEGNSLESMQLELNKKMAVLEKKIDANRVQYEKLKRDRDCPDKIRKCTIVVECKDSCKVSLLVSYVTTNAAWKPSYDIRMYSAEEMLKITYYGKIRQSTGEDWVDAKLFLSTAMPSIGGEVPELPTAELRLYKPCPNRRAVRDERNNRFGSFRHSWQGARPKSLTFSSYDDRMLLGAAFGDMTVAASPSVMHAETEVGEGVATTYEIHRRSTIPSDDVEHKVTVGLIDIKPKITYVSIPQRVQHAFMLAKVINNSPYTFLVGETSIFLDNSFVGKASIKDVLYPMEEFDCSLGVDPAVKITYKPQKMFQASSGILSKALSKKHEQLIEVKNTHDYGIHIVVMEQLPRSTSDRIKVTLLEPQIDLKHPQKRRDKGAVLNKNNNIEWTLDLKAQETREVVLKFTVDHPASFKLQTDHLDLNMTEPIVFED